MKRILTSLVFFIACALWSVAQARVELTDPDRSRQTYQSFTDAIQEIHSSGEWKIKLISDDKRNYTSLVFNRDVKLTIDLNGFNLTFSHDFCISKGNVVIDDTSANADGILCFILNSLYSSHGVEIEEDCSLKILNGTLYSESGLIDSLISNSGYFEVDGGKVEIISTYSGKTWLENDGITIIRNGTFEGGKIENSKFLWISGGSFTGDNRGGECLLNRSDLLITGGTFNNKVEVLSSGRFEIRGGLFEGIPKFPLPVDRTTGEISGGSFPGWEAISLGNPYEGWVADGYWWDEDSQSVIESDSFSGHEHFYVFLEYDDFYYKNQAWVRGDGLHDVRLQNFMLLGTSTCTYRFREKNNATGLKYRKISLNLNGFDINGTAQFDYSDVPVEMTGPGSISNLVFSEGMPVITKKISDEIFLPVEYAWDARGCLTNAVCCVTKNGRDFGFATIDEAVRYAPGEVVRLVRNAESPMSVSQDAMIDLNGFSLDIDVMAGVKPTLCGDGVLNYAVIGSGAEVCKLSDADIRLGDRLRTCHWSANHVLVMESYVILKTGNNTVNCYSVADAISRVQTDGKIAEIVLEGDLSEDNIVVTDGKRIRLDLNGYCIAGTNANAGVTVGNQGLLVLHDSGATQKVQTWKINNFCTLGIESGRYVAPSTNTLIYAAQMNTRIWIEGGELESMSYVLDSRNSSGGVEIRGGRVLGKFDLGSMQKLRILGGVFSADPSDFVIGARTVTRDAATGLYVVGKVSVELLTAETILQQMSGNQQLATAELKNVGVLTRTADGGTLKPEKPYFSVQGATVSLRTAGETEASKTVTSIDDTVEANKKMLLLNAAYDVTTNANGNPALDYVYDFSIDAFSVVSLSCDDPAKERHELRFTMGLREGEMRKSRTVTLDNAKVVVMCNDEKLPVVLEKPAFTNGVCEFVTRVETDKTDGRAKLFRLKLNSLTIK